MHYRYTTSAVSRPLSTLIALVVGAQLFITGQLAQAQQLPHSHARPDQVKIKHLHLNAKVDFDTKRISGSVTLTLDRIDPQAKLQLDSDGLEIRGIKSESGQPLAFNQPPTRKGIGQGLIVDLPAATDQPTKVIVEYTTDPTAAAVQWLSPEQTTDKKHPSPGVRMTYSAKLQVPKELLAVMSAANPQKKNDTGVYEFQMKQPIPSYLLALAVGDLKFVSVGERSGVYAEPSVLKKAAWELGDTERMIMAAEKLYGPYRWDRYDVIFLPSSFTVYFEQRIMEAVYGRRYSEMLAKLNLDGLQREVLKLDKRDTWLKLDLIGRNPDDGLTAIAYDKGYFFLRMLEEKVGREQWDWDAFLKDYFDKFAFQSMTTEG